MAKKTLPPFDESTNYTDYMDKLKSEGWTDDEIEQAEADDLYSYIPEDQSAHTKSYEYGFDEDGDGDAGKDTDADGDGSDDTPAGAKTHVAISGIGGKVY